MLVGSILGHRRILKWIAAPLTLSMVLNRSNINSFEQLKAYKYSLCNEIPKIIVTRYILNMRTVIG